MPAKNATQSAAADEMAEKPFVTDYLLYLLAAASEEASAQFHTHVRKNGLRVPEWRILACLNDWDGSMVTELSRYAMIEQSRLTKIIIQMDQRGLIQRQNDPRDGRKVRIFLTEEGRELSNRLVSDARIHEEELLASLEGTEGAQIKKTLKALLTNLDSFKHFGFPAVRNGAETDDQKKRNI